MLRQRPSMRRFVPCNEEGSRPECWEGETIDYQLDNVELSFDAAKDAVGTGSLFITTKRVVWLGTGESAFDFDVPFIVLHAISRDVDSYPKPCIYCQFDTEEGGGDDDEDEDEEAALDEMFLAPSREEDLKGMFDALSAAAMNNPDPPEDGEEEGDDELIFNAEEVELGAQQARALSHLESVFHLPGDPEEEEDGEQS
ncbi:regulator of volume decrease after cellular swelling-domain-containing protein [Ochromonadaceae sp. CCMP2298]|nr:regulator of volume decrease after cellular swelling-domain-containing protein [Ochromonadaceae sp. CCMP2298]